MTDLVAARTPFVDGAFVRGQGDPLSITDPGTEETVAEVAAASPEQFRDAVGAARRAFDAGPWPRMSADERCDALVRFADALDARRGALVETVIAEAGCPRTFTEMMQVGMGLGSVRDHVQLARSLPAWEHNELPLHEYTAGNRVKLSIRAYEPVGVVAAITPSNFPFTTNVWKVVPALATGCTVILRPSPQTPLEATVFGEAAEEAGLPAGVLNVVTEAGPTGAEILTTHPDVDLVSFTGSSAVGRLIGAQAGASMKRLILELGGKSVQLYLPDALEAGPSAAAMGAFGVFFAHAGQGCSLQTRMLVPHGHKAAVLDAVAAAAANLTIGDTRDAATTLGPVVSAASRDRIEGLVASGTAAGGRVVVGGARPADRDRGFYYEATVVDIDDNANPLAQTEVFGPVLTVQGYRDLDEAVAITNDSPYDLSAGIYTQDLAVGLDLVGRIRTGTVQVNTGAAGSFTPMGGHKHSGVGRERGVLGIRAFQQAKHVVVGAL
ncbi:MAG: aldehyde dehydrogenase family protein [Acidimicrobiia bacterium]